jgi:8-oxo-dGTP pyrophosphatase MutT (NUDIX family)
MLDLDLKREGAVPRDAATLVLVRNAPGPAGGIELFCVERNKKSAFMGGAIVFPGGKIDEADRDPRWQALTTTAHPTRTPIADDDAMLHAILVAACRESLEEAAILPVTGELAHADLLTLRAEAAVPKASFAALVQARGLRLDLGALRVFARWITPIAEGRRFDTRFVMAAAPVGQPGAHDERETVSSFWARPADVLARFAAGEVQLAPPTHRTLELLSACVDAAAALAWCETQNLAPICPRLVPQADTLALALPGDPEHDVPEPRVAGTSRFVLHGERWLPEEAPRR